MYIKSKSKEIAFIKNQTPFYTHSHYKIHIKFSLVRYLLKGKGKTTPRLILERLNVFNPNRYNKPELQELISNFL